MGRASRPARRGAWLPGLMTALVAGLAAGAASAAEPALSGFWAPAAPAGALRMSDGKPPPLNAAAAKLYRQRQAPGARGARGFDNGLQCRPLGIPRLMAESRFELVQTAAAVVFLSEWNRLQRLVELRAHNAFDKAYPYYLGHPAGMWQGQTLVVDSEYFNADTVLDASGLPHSDALHVIEHYRLRGPNELENTVTIEDAKTFTRPWQTVLRYQRLPADTQLTEDVCVQRLGLQGLNTHKNHLPGTKH